MKAMALKTTLGVVLALFSGATLCAAPASASSVNNAVYRGDSSGSVPSSYYQEVRRVIIVTPPYANDPYYYGPAYYGPAVPYAPPVAYGYAPPPAAYVYAPPPVAYEYAPPPGAYYGPGPGVEVGY